MKKLQFLVCFLLLSVASYAATGRFSYLSPI